MPEDVSSYVQSLDTRQAAEVAYAGGKGAMLARLLQAGFPVPPGCVLSPQVLLVCLAAWSLPPPDRPEALVQALLRSPLPRAVEVSLYDALARLPAAAHGWVVRSSAVAEDSATASYAGMYESFLAIATPDLGQYVRACWASWWSERALAYRQHLGLGDAAPAMGVVLQHLVPARCAGVAFTTEPLQGDASRMVIQAAPGLGTAVVAGVTQPEHYVLAKSAGLSVLETRLLHAEQGPLLPDEALASLSALLQRLESFCGQAQDVEWVWDGTACWIVQSRPITTLGVTQREPHADVWGNANLKDVMPGLVSPLTWSLMQPQLETAMRQQYRDAGYRVPPQRPLMRRFWGRPYFNISLFNDAAYHLYGVLPDQHAAALGGLVVAGAPGPRRASPWQRLRWLGHILRFVVLASRAQRLVPAQFRLVQQRWQEEHQQIPGLDRAALLRRLTQHRSVTQPFLRLHLHLSMAMSGHFSALCDLLASVVPRLNASGEPGHTPASLASTLVTALGGVSSAEHSYQLWALARQARQAPQVLAFLQQGDWATWQQALAGTPFGAAWQEFLDRFGHRALYEIELANPRWREQPDYLFEVLAAYAQMEQEEPPFDPRLQAQRRAEIERLVSGQLSWWQRGWFQLTLKRAREFSQLRENSKSHLVRYIDVGRLLALRAGTWLMQDGLIAEVEAVFYLEMEEMIGALQGSLTPAVLRQRIAQRRLAQQRDATRQAPDLLIDERPVYAETLIPQGRVLTGLPSSPGRVTGTARVLRTPHDRARLQPGDILVAPSTDPGWTPLFLLASGLVMETGGYLSHGAIVAREYGIPAVLNVSLATQRIPDGSTILLDGAQGTVHLVS
ncbi:MAG: PEP/pyruvate-binding domain-containing protein [Candidatus Tectimicrobiota bacterium]